VLSASKSYIHSYTPSTVTVYLDTRNNVSSAGHGNPAIADAVHQQMLLQNSNSR
jgi:4-aminobutyrate aminotransferase-like enzyme